MRPVFKQMKRALMLLAAALFLGIAAQKHAPLLNARLDAGLTQAHRIEKAPILINFTTVALGAFRGLIADFLWMRASRLQDERQYIEAVQLAHWITQLQPRFPEVWSYHAWNLSYNIGGLFIQPRERWGWVMRGVELLRDEALFYNPTSATLYRELAWMFQHKIAGRSDPAHLFYKRAWGQRMQPLLPPSHANYDAARLEQVYKMDVDQMRRIESTFGALDWRLAQTHAVYWAWAGLPYADGYTRDVLIRTIYQSLVDAFLHGSIVANPHTEQVLLGSNPAHFKNAQNALKWAQAQDPDRHAYLAAHEGLLRIALVEFTAHGRYEEAAERFAELQAHAPEAYTNQTIEALIAHTLLQAGGRHHLEERLAFWESMGNREKIAGYTRLIEILKAHPVP